MKHLANQTAKATDDISQKIVTVQNASTEAVNAIRTIGETIERMSEISSIVANAIQQQTEATSEISSNLQQATSGIHEVATNIINVTEAVKNSSGDTKEVWKASTELSKQAELLGCEINNFANRLDSVCNS